MAGFFFSSRRRHTRFDCDWSSDVCSSDLYAQAALAHGVRCSVTLAHQPGPEAVALSLFGARPRVLDPGQVPLAELPVAARGALVGNPSPVGGARPAALPVRAPPPSPAPVGPAEGIV